ncbi:MAG: putative rane protein [Gemmatimonadetes bacterium]|nr:putative rane protein [Gemmatimonadota bacterium]
MPLLFLAIGVGAGVLAGIFGIGGGIVIVPALVLLARMPASTAVGTSLAAILLPTGILGVWQYYKAGHVNVTASVCIALGMLAGVYFGARIGLTLSPVTARRAFAVFLVAVAGRVWFG